MADRLHISVGDELFAVETDDPASDLADLAAASAFALAKSHPYTDGNTRVASVVAEVFLELNGYDADRDDADVVTTMTALAAGSLGEESLARWFRAAMVPLPPEWEGRTTGATS